MGESLTVETCGPEETRAFGALLAEELEAGDFLAVDGGLAAGKTCFVQGVASGLGYRGPATSPTFTLLHIYEGGRMPLYHFDLYRLTAPKELENLGYEEYFYGDGVCAVEWSDLAADYLPKRRIGLLLEWVEADKSSGQGAERRRIRVTLPGADTPSGRARLERIAELLGSEDVCWYWG